VRFIDTTLDIIVSGSKILLFILLVACVGLFCVMLPRKD
jgi:hypothetical protein